MISVVSTTIHIPAASDRWDVELFVSILEAVLLNAKFQMNTVKLRVLQ